MLQRVSHAGVEFDVDERGLLDVRAGGALLADRVYLAVRTPDWSTVAPHVADLGVAETSDGARVTAMGWHRSAEAELEWRWVAEVSSAGLRFELDGAYLRRSTLAKAGLCVHHNLDQCRGRPYRAYRDGSVQRGALPDGIGRGGAIRELFDPYDRLEVDLTGFVLRHDFSGDLFEMQDHRNWMDYDLKSYGTPLSVPWPVVHERGESIRQSVRITAQGGGGPSPAAPQAETRVRATADPMRWAPVIASRVPLDLDPAEPPWELASLGLGRIVVDVDASGPSSDRIAAADRLAADLGAGLELATVIDLARVDEWIESVSRLALANLRRVRVAPLDGLSPGALPVAPRVEPLLSVGPSSSFAELNTIRPGLPAGVGVHIPLSPAFHVCDSRSLLRNLRSLPDLRAAVREIYPDAEASFGPISLIPDGGPYACGADDGGRFSSVDERLHTGFGAVWTLGVLAGLADRRRAVACLHDAWGPSGILGPADTMLRRLVALLGSHPDGWFALEADSWTVAALAADTDECRLVVLGSLGDRDERVVLEGAAGWEVAERPLAGADEPGWRACEAVVELPAGDLAVLRSARLATP